jgi:hypothetical protein
MLPAAFPVFQMKYGKACGEPEESQVQIHLLTSFITTSLPHTQHDEIGFTARLKPCPLLADVA